jgi:hypothetical protein
MSEAVMRLTITATRMSNNWINAHKFHSKGFQVTMILPRWMLITMHGYNKPDKNS